MKDNHIWRYAKARQRIMSGQRGYYESAVGALVAYELACADRPEAGDVWPARAWAIFIGGMAEQVSASREREAQFVGAYPHQRFRSPEALRRLRLRRAEEYARLLPGPVDIPPADSPLPGPVAPLRAIGPVDGPEAHLLDFV